MTIRFEQRLYPEAPNVEMFRLTPLWISAF